MDKVEATEIVLQGMTLQQIIIVALAAIILVCLLVWLVTWINKNQFATLRESFKGLESVPEQLSEIKSSLKSGNELYLMIKTQVQDHELACPARAGCQAKQQGNKDK